MDERERGRRRLESGSLRGSRRPARLAHRAKGRSAAAVPGFVAASDARRRMLRGVRGVSAAWAAVVLVDVVLIRAHVLEDTYTGISTLTGAVAGPLLLGIHRGWAGRPSLGVRDGRHLLSARTLTGVRTLDLDGLVGVRRFETIQRTGGYLDEFRLHDRQGVRLTATNERAVDAALRRALAPSASLPARNGVPTVRITRHARTALGVAPRSRVPRAVHRFWGLLMTTAATGVPALAGYLAACVLAGTGILGRPGH
ncbi:hypothetical protein [Streptomyces sp. KHY 26]|uniref:hypothetical protein n=1 Tax=Streptomyces sp. KHY 26 TaxID=3097359 RepID=UPI00376EA5F6